MIKLLKNKEVRKTLILQIIVAITGCIACFNVSNRAGIIAVNPIDALKNENL